MKICHHPVSISWLLKASSLQSSRTGQVCGQPFPQSNLAAVGGCIQVGVVLLAVIECVDMALKT